MICFWKVDEPFGEFSNWYKCKFLLNGHEFTSSEQAFMYLKAMLFRDFEIAKEILNTEFQAKIKALGRRVKNFDQTIWDKYKYDYMVYANEMKFSQNEDLLKILLETGNEDICEASPLDKIWGVGVAYPAAAYIANWEGENLLGKALMQVRSELSGK